MSQTHPFSCSCGTVTGTVPWGGFHAKCYCDSCRASDIHLGQADPGTDGVSVYQIPPDQIVFHTGQDKLALMQVTPKGAYRWYASCCNTPMFSTATTPKLAYAALKGSTANDPAAFGPASAQVHMKGADGRPHHKGIGRVVMRVASTSLGALMSGKWRQSPFFDAQGQPVAPPNVMPKEARAAILAKF